MYAQLDVCELSDSSGKLVVFLRVGMLVGWKRRNFPGVQAVASQDLSIEDDCALMGMMDTYTILFYTKPEYNGQPRLVPG